MVTRIQEWAAEQWFNGPQGGTPITAERLNDLFDQVEAIGVDMTALEAAIAGIDINDPDFDAFIAALDPTMRDIILGTGSYDLANAALVTLIQQNATSLYRGTWDAFTVETLYDLAGGYPAQITEVGVTDRIAVTQNVVGTNQPSGSIAQIGNPVGSDLNNNTAGVRITIPAGISSLRFWGIVTNGENGNNNSTIRYAKNGAGETIVRNTVNSTWTQHTIGVAPGDVVDVYIRDISNTQARGALAYFELLSSQKPYVVNEVVTYNGKLWRNTVLNNASVPGADANWVEALTGYIPTTADITKIVKISQAAYDALATKVATTLYVIVG